MLLPLQNNLLSGSDTNVSATSKAFTFTTYDAGITSDVVVAVAIKAFVFATYAATISSDVAVDVATQAFAFATYPATIGTGVAQLAATPSRYGSGRWPDDELRRKRNQRAVLAMALEFLQSRP